jgi:hypothetical protein
MLNVECSQEPIKPQSTRRSRRRRRPRRKNIYRIANWPAYNAGLKARGRVGFWLAPEAIAGWYYEGPQQRGGAYQYSDAAIETGLLVRLVYHLAWRQTEGLLESLLAQMAPSLEVPDYTTLARRSAQLLTCLEAAVAEEPLHVVVDSTGLKVFGEGEWKVRQPSYSKRRTWRKLHLAVDEATGQVVGHTLTPNFVDDASQVAALMGQIEGSIAALGADGAYDKRKVFSYLEHPPTGAAIQAIIPPRKDAKIEQHGNRKKAPLPRDEIIRALRKKGRTNWKKLSGYHRRSLSETCIGRYKQILGNTLRARKVPYQLSESRVGCPILNRMLQIARPQSYVVEIHSQ